MLSPSYIVLIVFFMFSPSKIDFFRLLSLISLFSSSSSESPPPIFDCFISEEFPYSVTFSFTINFSFLAFLSPHAILIAKL